MTDVYVDALHEFHTVMGNQYIEDGDERDRSALYHLRMRLIDEEALETHGALLDGLVRINARGKWDTSEYGDLAHLAKELADLLYVTFGTAEALRIPMGEVFRLVHESNMRKLGPDGKPIEDAGGKFIKPPGWVNPEPEIRRLLEVS